MKYLLMHKNIVVAIMEVDDFGDMSKVQYINNNKEHMPLGGQLNIQKLYSWWKDRAIPKTRQGTKIALEKLSIHSVNNLLVKNLALSLNDCYWIKPSKSNLIWEEVNLFRNNFIDIFGELTFDSNTNLENKKMFKCIASQGELQKKWCVANRDGIKTQFLVKGNYGESYQQSLNEVLASEIHRRQNRFPYVQYYLTDISIENGEKGIGCYSYNFCNENIESIPVWEILQLANIKQGESYYNKLVESCVSILGMNREYVENFLGYEILTDYLITNTDRHMNNISIIRNPDTLEVLGLHQYTTLEIQCSLEVEI